MTELLIIISACMSEETYDNLSKTLKKSITILDDTAKETNIKLEHNNNFIHVTVSGETSGKTKLNIEDYNNFVQNKQNEQNLNLVTIFIASETLEDNSKSLVNFRKSIYKFFKKIKLSDKSIDIKIIQKSSLEELVNASISKKIPIVNEKIKNKSQTFTPVKPKHTFNEVILDQETYERIQQAVESLNPDFQKKLEEMGLTKLQPKAQKFLCFHGDPGTGKTLAAEAVASELGKDILKVKSSEIESKFQGEAQKNIQAIFYAAQQKDAVLFFDEAESFLSKRLENTSSATDQTHNSTRGEILQELNDYNGIIIFATNLIEQFDEAFNNRIIEIKFERPSKDIRKQIWEKCLGLEENSEIKIPLSNDVDTEYLAMNYDFVGRDIKNAVFDAVESAYNKQIDKFQISQFNLVKACERISSSKISKNSREQNTSLKFKKESKAQKMPSDDEIEEMIQKYKDSKKENKKKFLFFGINLNKKENKKK